MRIAFQPRRGVGDTDLVQELEGPRPRGKPHAVRGKDALLISTFEFAGPVSYAPPKDAATPFAVPTATH